MTKDDVLFGYRQQLFAEAARTSVSAACRTFGVRRDDRRPDWADRSRRDQLVLPPQRRKAGRGGLCDGLSPKQARASSWPGAWIPLIPSVSRSRRRAWS
jgi:hypothetical protein